MQDDERPRIRLEAEESAFDLVAVRDGRLDAGDGGRMKVRELDVDAMAPKPSRLIDAGMDEHPMHPGVEEVRIPQRGQVAPGADERVLHGVLGLFGIAEDEPGGRVQTGDRGACQLGEGVMIALPRSLHEVSLHHAPRRWRGRRGHARPVWRGDVPVPFHISVSGASLRSRRGTIAVPISVHRTGACRA